MKLRLKAIIRRNQIADTKNEMQHLRESLFDILMNARSLNRPQRMEVLKWVVSDVKQFNEKKLQEDKLNHIESEQAKDIVNSIQLFAL